MRQDGTAICQRELPVKPWAERKTRRLPGLNPVAPGEWLLVDEAYAPQMALRERLLAEKRAEVLRLAPDAVAATEELLEAVLAEIADKPGFTPVGAAMHCPDGRSVVLDRAQPLATAARLVQEDLVVLQKPDGAAEHVLAAAALCFPASWSLDEKFGHPLTRIHAPVADYTGDIARRVQRVFDGLQPGRPIGRMNYLIYADPALFQPRRETEMRLPAAGSARWVRVERQVLTRLPASRAVVFSIHTYVMEMARLSSEDRVILAALKSVD